MEEEKERKRDTQLEGPLHTQHTKTIQKVPKTETVEEGGAGRWRGELEGRLEEKILRV